MTSREESVLAAGDPSLDDENDWEEFSLSDVRILFPGKSRYANLLNASPDNPVQVTGCLDEVEEEQESLVLDEDYLSKRIVIENVTHYAYGQHDDGEVGIWVAGRAGWFSISPARGYRPMFNDMVEAIDLLYFLADRHQMKRRKRRRSWNPSVQYLCEEYVYHTHGICEDADDSAEVFYKHRNFLLSRMFTGEEGVEWAKTNLFGHLCEKFPEDHQRIKALYEPKEVGHNEDDEEENGEANDDENDDGNDEPNDEENDKAHQANELTEHSTHSFDDLIPKAQADTIYQVILELKEAGHLAKRQLNIDLVIFTLVGRYKIENAGYARDLISARADIIIDMMDEAKTPSFDWSRRAIYRELKSMSQQNHLQHIVLTPLRPRLPDDDVSSSSSEESSHGYNPKLRRRRVQKSVLRPKSSVSSKQVGKRTRNVPEREDLSDGSQDGLDDFETPSKVPGHEFARHPLSTRAKQRTRSILSDPGNVTTPFHKTPLQETLQTRNTSVSTGERDASELGVDDPYPDLPPDTWMCRVKGCGKIIYKSSSKRGKEVIQDHSLAHADDVQKKIDLVFAEQRLNVNLPVDNLISRIRQFGALDPDPTSIGNEAKHIRT